MCWKTGRCGAARSHSGLFVEPQYGRPDEPRNLVFCKHGASVVTILRSEPTNRCYWRLRQPAFLTYCYVFGLACGPADDIEVDSDKLERTVDAALRFFHSGRPRSSPLRYHIRYRAGGGLGMKPRDQSVARVGKVANIALAMAGAFALCAFLRFLYKGLSGERRFSTWRDIALYYVVPAGMACLLFASLRWQIISRLRLLMLVVAVSMSLYAVELFLVLSGDGSRPVMLSLTDSRDREGYAADLNRRFGSPIDIRRGTEVIADLQKKGVDAIPIVTASNHLFVTQPDGSINSAIRIDDREVMPLGSVSGQVTLLCNENGGWIDYRSDSRGFNNPDEVWQSTRLDIAAVGDSFTQGYCVPRDRNFVDLIRQHDSATLNLGMAGDGPLLMLATLKEYLPRFAPKIVLWFYFEGNDLTDLQRERRSALLRNYLKNGFGQRELTQQGDIDRAILAELPRLAEVEQQNFDRRTAKMNIYRLLIYRLLPWAKLTSLRQRIGPISDTDPGALETAADFDGANMEVFREIVNLAKTEVEAWNGELYFVYLPDWARYSNFSLAGVSQTR